MEIAAMVVVLGLAASNARAGVIEYTDRQTWETAVGGDFDTIDFTGFPAPQIITDEYADQGVLFPDGDDAIFMAASFLNDGWGMTSPTDIRIQFDSPRQWFGIDHPGHLQLALLRDGKTMFESGLFEGSGAGFFAGLVSTEAFDEVVIADPFGFPHVDDLFFGFAIPAPASWGVAALWFVGRDRRRPFRKGKVTGDRKVTGDSPLGLSQGTVPGDCPLSEMVFRSRRRGRPGARTAVCGPT